MSKCKIQLIGLNETIEQQAYDLLNQYEETSLFLLSNLKTYGVKLTEDTYSADFKYLIKNGQVVAVFALTKRGSLIVQTDRASNYQLKND